jgi:hypothetical protein
MCKLKMTKNLELKINILKKKMVRIGSRKGLDNQETLKYSQMLDKLIFEYQLSKNKKLLFPFFFVSQILC